MDNLHAVKGQKAPTSYGRLRKKYLACKVELAELKGVDYEKTNRIPNLTESLTSPLTQSLALTLLKAGKCLALTI